MSDISGISFNSSIDGMSAALAKNKTSADKVSNTVSSLNLDTATDKEMMDACKSFETYFLQKIIKTMKDTMAPSEEEEGDYMEQFGDLLYEEYAKMISDSGSIGVAQQLYESMKLQQKAVVSPAE